MADEKTYKLKTQNGKFIVGTLESIPGTAQATRFTVDEEGTLVPDYEGETDVNWDGQETQVDGYEKAFVDRLVLATEGLIKAVRTTIGEKEAVREAQAALEAVKTATFERMYVDEDGEVWIESELEKVEVES